MSIRALGVHLALRAFAQRYRAVATPPVDLALRARFNPELNKFVILAQAVLYRAAGLSVVWPQFVALAAIGSALFGYALARFRKTISTMT